MSTTEKYNFVFILQNSLRETPIPFEQFKKPLDEEGNDQGYYTYNEFMSLDGNSVTTTPSNTHVLLSVNATSILALATLFPQYVSAVSPDTIIVEGVEKDKWLDENQDNYLWIISTDPKAIGYDYKTFIESSPLFTE